MKIENVALGAWLSIIALVVGTAVVMACSGEDWASTAFGASSGDTWNIQGNAFVEGEGGSLHSKLSADQSSFAGQTNMVIEGVADGYMNGHTGALKWPDTSLDPNHYVTTSIDMNNGNDFANLFMTLGTVNYGKSFAQNSGTVGAYGASDTFFTQVNNELGFYNGQTHGDYYSTYTMLAGFDQLAQKYALGGSFNATAW
jgi:hypothetical protein